MKKCISLSFVFIMLTISFISATAQNSIGIIGGTDGPTEIYVSSDNYMSLEEALISVKEKVNIPHKLSEFESGTQNGNNGVKYNFAWSNPEGDTIAVSCDGQAHITDYEYYSPKLYTTYGSMKLFKRDAARETAEEFLKTIFPEGFADENDRLIYNDDKSSSYKNSYGTRFNLVFERIKDGIKVKDNSASVYILANSEGMTITFAATNFDFTRTFGENTDRIENIKDAYIGAYPMELVYESEYSYRNNDNKTKMIYRFQDNNYGYIKAADGEIALLDEENKIYMSAGATKDEASVESSMGANRAELTPGEITEIEKNKNLKTPDFALNLIKSVPEFKIGNEFYIDSSSVYKTGNGYAMNISLTDGSQYVYAELDAENGQLLSYNGISNYEKAEELQEYEIKFARNKIEEFLKKYAVKEYETVEFGGSFVYGANVSYDYTRFVNGIKYINNGINVTYDTKNKTIIRYSLNFDNNKEFDDVNAAVDIKSAYDKVLDTYLIPVYAPVNGKYELCYTVDIEGIAEVDAITGKMVSYGNEKIKYIDIEKHWCQDAVKVLAEYGIGIYGKEFLPDNHITQEELLRFIANGLYSRSYTDTDNLYKEMISRSVIKDDEKNPAEKVTREDTFKYFTRAAGYGRIGEISQIYKSDFKDSGNISKDHIGYAAILSGLNVISGFDGNLRPQDYITRAETAVMIYNYLNCDVRD